MIHSQVTRFGLFQQTHGSWPLFVGPQGAGSVEPGIATASRYGELWLFDACWRAGWMVPTGPLRQPRPDKLAVNDAPLYQVVEGQLRRW